jgi:ubiquitin C-terminal hydrolase
MATKVAMATAAGDTVDLATLILPVWRHPQIAWAGLVNSNNTCFMLAVLQALSCAPPLGNVAIARTHQLGHSCGALPAECMACIFMEIIGQILWAFPTVTMVDPASLRAKLSSLVDNYVPGQHQDAHELLRRLVAAAEQAMLAPFAAQEAAAGTVSGTLVSALFAGAVATSTFCLQCGRESRTVDPTRDLMLTVARWDAAAAAAAKTAAEARGAGSADAEKAAREAGWKGVRSVVGALQQLVAFELLEDATCTACGKGQRAKTMRIWDPPNVLVLHFNRTVGAGVKLRAPIDFEATLDLDPFIAPAARVPAARRWQRGRLQDIDIDDDGANYGPDTYVLNGVVVHKGPTARLGHYYTYGQNAHGWHCANDATVTRCGPAPARARDSAGGGGCEGRRCESVLCTNHQTLSASLVCLASASARHGKPSGTNAGTSTCWCILASR